MQIQISMNPPVIRQINIIIPVYGKRTVYQRGVFRKDLHAYAVTAQVGRHAHIYPLFLTGIKILHQQLGIIISYISFQSHVKRFLPRFRPIYHSTQQVYSIHVLLHVQIDRIQHQTVRTQSI